MSASEILKDPYKVVLSQRCLNPSPRPPGQPTLFTRGITLAIAVERVHELVNRLDYCRQAGFGPIDLLDAIFKSLL